VEAELVQALAQHQRFGGVVLHSISAQRVLFTPTWLGCRHCGSQ
jgi:hypothetical protein